MYTGPDYRPYLDAVLSELETLERIIIAAAILQRVNRSPEQLAREADEYLRAMTYSPERER